MLTSEIDGTIQMKSYLTGNPEIRLALNEELSIGRGGRTIHGISLISIDVFVALSDIVMTSAYGFALLARVRHMLDW